MAESVIRNGAHRMLVCRLLDVNFNLVDGHWLKCMASTLI